MMSIIIYVLNAAMLVLISGLYYRRYAIGSGLQLFYWPALVLKIIAGIALGLVFKYYYEVGDTIRYFEEGCRFADIAGSNFWDYIRSIFDKDLAPFKSIYHNQPRALFMAKITSVFALITHKNYWLTSVYFSLFAFMGLWALAQTVYKIYGNKLAIVLSLLAFPSMVFWSSGVSKESLALGALAWLLSSLLNYNSKSNISMPRLLIDVAAFILLWKIRYFYAGVLVLSLSSGLLTLFISNKVEKIKHQPILQAFTFLLCGIVMSWAVSLTKHNFRLENISHVIAKNHNAFVKKSSRDELIHFEDIDGSVLSLLKNAPEAAFSGLFRPLPSDGANILSYFTQLENTIILLLSIIALLLSVKKMTLKKRILLFSAITYVLLLATFLALSTPNFGSLVRYKVGFLPILLLLITIDNPLIKRLNQRLFS